MDRGLAIALFLASGLVAFGTAIPVASAQQSMPAQCMKFRAINEATQLKANAVQVAMKAKADRKDICRLMTAFVASESSVVKFLVDNETWCGIPDQAVSAAKASHEKSIKFRDAACTAGPSPKAETLSDAIKTAPVDSATNTKAGRFGTFDTLTGNPLAK